MPASLALQPLLVDHQFEGLWQTAPDAERLAGQAQRSPAYRVFMTTVLCLTARRAADA